MLSTFLKQPKYNRNPERSLKPTVEIGRMAFKDELKRSVLLDINCQADDTLESKTVDGYKMHLEHLNKRLKSNGCDTIYTACVIGQCLTELKHIYRVNKKLFICATKDMFIISYVYFFIDLCDLATTYYRVSRISLLLRTVQRKFKLIRRLCAKMRISGCVATNKC